MRELFFQTGQYFTGPVFGSVSPGDSVGKGNDVAKICRGTAVSDVIVKSVEAGRIYPLAEEGKIVARCSPLFMVFTEETGWGRSAEGILIRPAIKVLRKMLSVLSQA